MIRSQVGFASASGYPSLLRCLVLILDHLTHITNKSWRHNNECYQSFCIDRAGLGHGYIPRLGGICSRHDLD